MLHFKTLEHFDEFDTVTVYWVDVTGAPQKFINEAKILMVKSF